MTVRLWLFCYIIPNYECLGQIKHFFGHLSRKHFKLSTINKLTITFTLEDDNKGNCSSFMVSDSFSFLPHLCLFTTSLISVVLDATVISACCFLARKTWKSCWVEKCSKVFLYIINLSSCSLS